MSKKKPIDPLVTEKELSEETAEFTELQAESKPIESIVEKPNLRPGYVQIKHNTSGGIIIVKAEQFGRIYLESDWTLITDEKKR
jgi:hypothetical protein